MTDDEKVAQRYRELGAEEPPRALDEAILAAARREAGARPGAPQVRSSRQRWYAPLATAAVLVLAVAVALQTQVEQPDTATSTPRLAKPAQPAIQVPATQAPAPPAAPVAPRAATDDVARAAPDQARPKAAATRAEPPAFAPDPLPQTSPGPARAPSVASGALAGAAAERDERAARADLSRERSQAPASAEAMAKRSEAPARALAESPERELERIAELRAQGRQDEADRALAEFRKRHPDYRIAEDMLRRVERR